MYSFEAEHLIEAIAATFRHRGTRIEAAPIGLTEAFYADRARATQWRTFLRRSRFPEEHGDLEKLVADVRHFAFPLLAAGANEQPFKAHWLAGGPWE
jgi:hypothetical protein